LAPHTDPAPCAIMNSPFSEVNNDKVSTTVGGWRTSNESYTGSASVDMAVVKLFIVAAVLFLHLVALRMNKPRFFIGAVLAWTVILRVPDMPTAEMIAWTCVVIQLGLLNTEIAELREKQPDVLIIEADEDADDVEEGEEGAEEEVEGEEDEDEDTVEAPTPSPAKPKPKSTPKASPGRPKASPGRPKASPGRAKASPGRPRTSPKATPKSKKA